MKARNAALLLQCQALRQLRLSKELAHCKDAVKEAQSAISATLAASSEHAVEAREQIQAKYRELVGRAVSPSDLVAVRHIENQAAQHQTVLRQDLEAARHRHGAAQLKETATQAASTECARMLAKRERIVEAVYRQAAHLREKREEIRSEDAFCALHGRRP